MNKQLTLSRQTLYSGRNGIAKLTGLHLFMDSKDNLNIFPLNTRGGSAKTFLEIPKEDIPALIALLQESIGQTPAKADTRQQAHEKEFEEINFDYEDDKGVTFVDGYHMNSEEGECLGYIFSGEFYPKDNDIRTNKQVMEAVSEHLAELRQQVAQVAMFHLSTLDSDAGSMGLIKGSSTEELNAALKRAIAANNDVDEDTVFLPEINWQFWTKQHAKEIIVTYTEDGEPVEQTIEATYTWEQ